MPVWGPVTQDRGTDVRRHVNYRGGTIILLASALTADTVVRGHDPGTHQPRLDNPNPYPDYFTSVVIERSLSSPVQIYLGGHQGFDNESISARGR